MFLCCEKFIYTLCTTFPQGKLLVKHLSINNLNAVYIFDVWTWCKFSYYKRSMHNYPLKPQHMLCASFSAYFMLYYLFSPETISTDVIASTFMATVKLHTYDFMIKWHNIKLKIHFPPVFQGTLHRKSESLSLSGGGGVDLTAREEEIIFSGIFFNVRTQRNFTDIFGATFSILFMETAFGKIVPKLWWQPGTKVEAENFG